MEKSKGKKFLLVAIIFLLLLLVLIGVGYAYIATDLFKTPDQLFQKYLISDVVEIINGNYEPYKEAFKRMETEPTEIVSKVKMEDSYGEEIETTASLKTDIPNKNKSLNIDMKKDNKDYFALDFLITDNVYGVHIDGIHDKHIAVENRDLKKIAETFELDEEIVDAIPDSIPETLLTKEEQNKLKKISEKYIINIFNQIDKNGYSQESYSEEFEGKALSGNKYNLTISNVKLGNIIKKTIEEIFKDDEVLSLLEGKIPQKKLDSIKEEFNDIELDEESEKDKIIKISVYTSNGKTVKLETYIDDKLNTEIYTLMDNTSSRIRLRTISPKDDFVEVASETLVNITNTFENNNGELVIETKKSYNKNDLKNAKNKYIEMRAHDDEDYDYYSSYYDEFYGDLYKDSKTTYKMTTTVENDVIKSKISSSGDDAEIKNSTFTIKFGNDVKVPKLNKNDAIIVNDYEKKEFENLGTEIIQNIGTYTEENSNTLIGEMFGVYKILNGNNLFNDSYEQNSDDRFSLTTEDDDKTYEDVVDMRVSTAIKSLLDEYHNDFAEDENTNPADYLTIQKIEDELLWGDFSNIDILGGNVLKSEYKDKIYFTTITINADDWELEETETKYSEDGILE